MVCAVVADVERHISFCVLYYQHNVLTFDADVDCSLTQWSTLSCKFQRSREVELLSSSLRTPSTDKSSVPRQSSKCVTGISVRWCELSSALWPCHTGTNHNYNLQTMCLFVSVLNCDDNDNDPRYLYRQCNYHTACTILGQSMSVFKFLMFCK